MRTEWLQMIDAYLDEVDTTYLSKFYFWPRWLIQYNDDLPIGSYIEKNHLIWKSEEHILTPKYEIFRSFVPLVKQ